MGKRKKPPPPRKRAAPKPAPAATRPWLPAAVLLGIVAIAVVVFILTRPGPPKPPPKHVNVVAELSALAPSELATVGKGSAITVHLKNISEASLTSGGKPEFLYIGAEYCPYCAGERWAMIVALSRFGTFSGVQTITSTEGDLPTFTFHGASYNSPYLVFRPVEAADRNGNVLDKPTTAESALERKYSTGYPFVDFGNRLVFEGATFDVSTLEGVNWQQVVTQLKQPDTSLAQGILGSANVITASLCQLTEQQPSAVCSDPAIQSLEKQLPS